MRKLPTYYQECTSIGVSGAKNDSCFMMKTLAFQLLSVSKVRIAVLRVKFPELHASCEPHQGLSPVDVQ